MQTGMMRPGGMWDNQTSAYASAGYGCYLLLCTLEGLPLVRASLVPFVLFEIPRTDVLKVARGKHSFRPPKWLHSPSGRGLKYWNSTTARLKRIDPPQQPLHVTISAPRLELRLHVAGKICFRPHEPALKVLHTHHSLVVAETFKAARYKDILVQQIC